MSFIISELQMVLHQTSPGFFMFTFDFYDSSKAALFSLLNFSSASCWSLPCNENRYIASTHTTKSRWYEHIDLISHDTQDTHC